MATGNIKPFLRYDNLDKEEVLRWNFQRLEQAIYNQTTNNDDIDSNTTDVSTNTTNLATHIADVADPHSVTKTQVDLGNVVNTLYKLDATTAPTINDDTGDGYTAGSLWVDVTNSKSYMCHNPASGAAVWIELTQSGGGGSTFTTKLSVSMSGNWSLSNNLVQKMAGFDTADIDANNDWNAVNDRWDCPTTGDYLCITGLEVASSATGIRASYFYIDGVRASRESSEPHSGQGCSWTHSKILNLTAGEYVEVYAFQDSGSAKNVIAGVGSFFQIIGPILT
jgi:hypothetical protein